MGSPPSLASVQVRSRRQVAYFWFNLDAELIVWRTGTSARVTLQGEPINSAGGTFTMRYGLPDSGKSSPPSPPPPAASNAIVPPSDATPSTSGP